MIRKLLKIPSGRMADRFRMNLHYYGFDELEEVYYNQWSFYDNSDNFSEASLTKVLNNLDINTYQITVED